MPSTSHYSPDHIRDIAIKHGKFVDGIGRSIILRGINFACDAKLPMGPKYTPSHVPLYNTDLSDDSDMFDGTQVSFVNSPVSVEEVDAHLARLKSWGFNTLRYIFTWEALEHSKPGVYDDDFVQFTIDILLKVRKFGFYVIMDPHQDVWSRYCGGSGAPLWTLHLAGLNPKNFKVTETALLESHFEEELVVQRGPNGHTFEDSRRKGRPKMMWSSNYSRLAAQTMWTLFYAGKHYAPKCTLNGGTHIQDFLQDSFANAVKYLAKQIHEKYPELEKKHGGPIIGWEALNEPDHGFVGIEDLHTVPKTQKVKLYHTPSGAQSMALGSGFKQDNVAIYQFSNAGPKQSSTCSIDPKGMSAWLTKEQCKKVDEYYGWTRDSSWEPGVCIWKQHGVWKEETNKQDPNHHKFFVMLKPDYFSTSNYHHHPALPYDRFFIDVFFVPQWVSYASKIRQVVTPDEAFLFFQPPVLCVPPNLNKLAHEGKIPLETVQSMVYCPHFYDGLTLMLKKWNQMYNVDAVGVLRNRYGNPPLMALRFGEKNIKASFASQLSELEREGHEKLGKHVPCLVSEIGIPYDMDDKRAYVTGDFSSQIKAMDANNHALEISQLSFTLWTYSTKNTNKYGDGWNGEDLSIWSNDDVGNKINPPKLVQINTQQDEKISNNNNQTAPASPSKKKKLLSRINSNSTALSSKGLNKIKGSKSHKNGKNFQSIDRESDKNSNVMQESPSSNDSDEYSSDSDETNLVNNTTTTATIETNSSSSSSHPSNTVSSLKKHNTNTSLLERLNFHDPQKYLTGARAYQSFIRPYPISVSGTISFFNFDLAKGTFILRIKGSGKTVPKSISSSSSNNDNDNDNNTTDEKKLKFVTFEKYVSLTKTTNKSSSSPSSNQVNEEKKKVQWIDSQFKPMPYLNDLHLVPTVVFVPSFQFPYQKTGVSTSSGTWHLDRHSQLLYWWHLEGSQELVIKAQTSSSKPVYQQQQNSNQTVDSTNSDNNESSQCLVS